MIAAPWLTSSYADPERLRFAIGMRPATVAQSPIIAALSRHERSRASRLHDELGPHIFEERNAMRTAKLGGILIPAMLALMLLPAAPAWARKKDSADDYPSQVASVWFDLLYDVVKSEGSSPPVASRIY